MLLANVLTVLAMASENEVCPPAGNPCMPGMQGQYWQENGGQSTFGLPISAPAIETDPDGGRTTLIQWVGRGGLEAHATKEVLQLEVSAFNTGVLPVQAGAHDHRRIP